jgi:hypothetical protein
MTAGNNNTHQTIQHATNDHVDHACLGRRLRRAKRRLLFQYLENATKPEQDNMRGDVSDTIRTAKKIDRSLGRSSREASRSIPTQHVAMLLRDASNLHVTRAHK